METKAREYFARIDNKVIPLNRNHSLLDEEQKIEMIAGGFGVTEESFSDCTILVEKSAYNQLQKRVAELEFELGKPYDKVDRLFEENKKLMAENNKLREALSKFSDPNFYWTKPPTVEDGWIVYGSAKKMAELLNAARQALGEVGE